MDISILNEPNPARFILSTPNWDNTQRGRGDAETQLNQQSDV